MLGVHGVHPADDSRQVCFLVNSDPGVHVGHRDLQLLAEALNETARDDYHLYAAGTLEDQTAFNRPRSFFNRRLQETAGVHDEDIGFIRYAAKLKPGLREITQHVLRINEVLGAAERNNADGH